MKGTSKVIMGATLLMVLTLALVLALVIVLLAELYCSLLLRRRKNRPTTATVSDIATSTSSVPPPPPLSSFYAHGVLDAPRNLLFPKIDTEENVDFEKQIQISPATPHRFGLVISSPNQETTGKVNDCDEIGVGGTKQFVYISNPIFDNNASGVSTPFETPDTSPSRLEDGGGGSSSDGEREIVNPFCSSSVSITITITPPLSPMKKLPKEACSVSLRDARSLGVSGSDSNSGDDKDGASSSSSGSPNTSPSW